MHSSKNILHNFIIDEMKKKEKILEQVLEQTKSIRMSFESFQQNIEEKNYEISLLKQDMSQLKDEVKQLKTRVDDSGTMKNSLTKLKQELIKMKIVQKLKADSDRDSDDSRGLLDWHRKLEMQHKQQKLCKACRREAKHRYKAHRSQEW